MSKLPRKTGNQGKNPKRDLGVIDPEGELPTGNEDSEQSLDKKEESFFEGPKARITAPDFTDWHMILDHELGQISRPEAGVIGSLGFVGVGGALGFAQDFADTLSNAYLPLPTANAADDAQRAPPLQISDIVSIAGFVGCIVLAVVCLAIFCIGKWRNKGLVASIRARAKRPFIWYDDGSEGGEPSA